MRCSFLESRIGIPHAMQDKLTLMIPGPTPVPETVLKAMGRHPIGHRSGEFQAIVRRTTEQLKWLHQTSSDVLVITGSGTAAMEAGMINPQPWRQSSLRRQRKVRRALGEGGSRLRT